MLFNSAVYMALNFIFVMLISIIIHEFTHAFILSKHNKGKYDDVRLRIKGGSIVVGEEKHYTHLSRMKLLDVYLGGILLGILPIIIFYADSRPHPYWIISLLVIYFIGSMSDLYNIFRFCILGRKMSEENLGETTKN